MPDPGASLSCRSVALVLLCKLQSDQDCQLTRNLASLKKIKKLEGRSRSHHSARNLALLPQSGLSCARNRALVP